jgi:type IV pilus assembly protein PilO
MKHYVFEIIRQKWRLLTVLLVLLLLNVALGFVVSVYQSPSLVELQNKWTGLRNQASRTGRVDAATLHKQAGADLEKLKLRIPEKREFARVLSDLYESASSSAVEVGAVSYKQSRLKEEPIYSYQLTLPVSGSYAALKSFLSDLQDNQELLVVDSVSYTNSDQFIEHVIMNLHLTIYLREGA